MRIGVVSAGLYLAGCLLLIPATVLLYFATLANVSIAFFIAATAVLTVAAVVDCSVLCRRTLPRSGEMSPLVSDVPAPPRVAATTVLVLTLYFLGGVLFLTGSTLFWPSFGTSIPGIWTFRFGSVSYFVGSCVLLVIVWPARRHVQIASLLVYSTGSLAYIAGGVLSELHYPGVYSTSVWMFGAVCFVLGAVFGLASALKSPG